MGQVIIDEFVEPKAPKIITDHVLIPTGGLSLYEVCNEVAYDYAFRQELAETLKSAFTNSGVLGVAANQLGIISRAFCVNIAPVSWRSKQLEVFFNPKIIEKSKEIEIAEEGCLSFPDFYCKVPRSKMIRIEYETEDSKLVTEEFSGLIALVIQHEMDHLNGMRFFDKRIVKTMHRKQAIAKYQKFLIDKKRGLR